MFIMIYLVKVFIIKIKIKMCVYVFIILYILYLIKLYEDIYISVFENYILLLCFYLEKKIVLF